MKLWIESLGMSDPRVSMGWGVDPPLKAGLEGCPAPYFCIGSHRFKGWFGLLVLDTPIKMDFEYYVYYTSFKLSWSMSENVWERMEDRFYIEA